MGSNRVDWETSKYFCDACKESKSLTIRNSKHQDLVEKSKNGLVTYSHVHSCKNGLDGINNLQIDGDYNIRSIENLELPEYQEPSLAIPKPQNKDKSEQKRIFISHIHPTKKLHLDLILPSLNIKIRIGRIPQESDSLDIITSNMESVELRYFESDFEYDEKIKNWFQYLIDVIEIVPPRNLGLIITAIRYMMDLFDRNPNKFDEKFMKTILSSHEIYYSLDIADREIIGDKLSSYDSLEKEDMDIIYNFINILENNPNMPIQSYTDLEDHDLIYLIYLFLILEKEQIINIDRPGIVLG